MNRVQQLNLELMELGSFNEFDGERVARDLRNHEPLWRGAIFTRLDAWPLIPLRDMPDGHWNANTLYILPVRGKELELFELVSRWQADECDWIGGREAFDLLGQYRKEDEADERIILRLWWD